MLKGCGVCLASFLQGTLLTQPTLQTTEAASLSFWGSLLHTAEQYPVATGPLSLPCHSTPAALPPGVQAECSSLLQATEWRGASS